jgi:hypothetical protein
MLQFDLYFFKPNFSILLYSTFFNPLEPTTSKKSPSNAYRNPPEVSIKELECRLELDQSLHQSAEVNNENDHNHLLPYPVLGVAQAGKGGSVHPDGAAVIVYVLV